MNSAKKLILVSLALFQAVTTFGMRPRSTTRTSEMQPQSVWRGLAATVAPVQSTEHKTRVGAPTMEYQPDEWQEIEGAEQVEQAAAPSPSEQTTQSPSQQLEVMDKQLLERILNPRPENPNPVDVNNPIIIDPSDMQAITPLGLAAFWGWEDIINQLCTKGALVNEPMPTNTLPDLEGFTPLHIAVMFNKIPAARALLAHQANVNAKIASTSRYKGYTPLDIAKAGGEQFNGMIAVLTHHGAQTSISSAPPVPNRQSFLLTQHRIKQEPVTFDLEGQTPLINAIQRGNVDLVKELIARGSNPDTPIAELEHNKNPLTGFSPLCLASFCGNKAIIEVLLQHGANPNYVIKNNTDGWNGFTPLHIAIRQYKTNIVECLINHGAEINKSIVTYKGYKLTPMAAAAYMGYSDIIQLLYNFGGLIDNTVDGFTPLHLAILQKHYNAVYVLIENKAKINITIDNPSKEIHNFDPVCLAVRTSDANSLSILYELIEAHADLQHKICSGTIYNGYTPFTLAMLSGNLPAIMRLVEAGLELKNEEPLDAFIQLMQTPGKIDPKIKEYINKVILNQQLLEKGQEFNILLIELSSIRKDGRYIPIDAKTAQKLVDIQRILTIIKELVRKGADPNFKDKKDELGRTPLFFAITKTNTEREPLSEQYINILLEAGANPNTTTKTATPLLTLATEYNNPHIVKILLDAGADPQLGRGMKPLEIAREKKYTDIENMLLQAIHDRNKKTSLEKPSRIRRAFSTLSKTLKR